MCSLFSQAFANFRRREDGPTTVEYAVMMALAIVGLCIAAVTSRGTSATSPRADSFTLTFRSDAPSSSATRDQRSAGTRGLTAADAQNGYEVKAAATERGNASLTSGNAEKNSFAKTGNAETASPPSAGAGSNDSATSANDKGDDGKTDQAVNIMSEEDARRAILGLLKAYPETFAASRETIEAAAVVRAKDHINIASFTCYLKAREFAFRPASAQFAGGVFGVFYQNDNGEWTGRITRTVR
jgi:Flp pilus assembly pilin Flp